MNAIVYCKHRLTKEKSCPFYDFCLAWQTDGTVIGCGMPLYYAGIIKKEDIKVEHLVVEANEEGSDSDAVD